jgi:hypothetical protein
MSSQSQEPHTGGIHDGKGYLGNVLSTEREFEGNEERTSISIPLFTLQKVTGIFKKEFFDAVI